MNTPPPPPPINALTWYLYSLIAKVAHAHFINKWCYYMFARKYEFYFKCVNKIRKELCDRYSVYFINGKRKFTWKVCIMFHTWFLIGQWNMIFSHVKHIAIIFYVCLNTVFLSGQKLCNTYVYKIFIVK